MTLFRIAPLDRKAWLTLAAFFAIPVVGISLFGIFDKSVFEWNNFKSVLIYTSVMIVFSYFLKIKSYALEGNSVIIKRNYLAADVRIPFSKITNVEMCPDFAPNDFSFSISNKFLANYHGNFTHKELGEMEWYTTNKSRLVRIDTVNKIYIISPNEPFKFVQHLKSLVNIEK